MVGLGPAALRPQQQEARDGGGARVLGRQGDEPRRWRRLLHVGHEQAAVGQLVHVAAERPVDEGQQDAGLDLLQRLVLVQVGADAPVLLGRVEHSVVDPATFRRLEQRVVEEQHQPPARAQHAAISSNVESRSTTCSSTRQTTTASNAPDPNGSAPPVPRT